jgi:hypothetical protein
MMSEMFINAPWEEAVQHINLLARDPCPHGHSNVHITAMGISLYLLLSTEVKQVTWPNTPGQLRCTNAYQFLVKP